MGTNISKAVTATDVLNKAASKIKSAKGLEVAFNISGGGNNLSGELMAAGGKFHIKAGGNETWYNGSDMYTYSGTSKETTVVKPSQSELSEVNPLVFINSYGAYFSPVFSNNKQNGKYIVDLKPKSRKAPVKKVTIFMNSQTFTPEKFIVTSHDGRVSTITVKKFSIASIPSSTFDYPKQRFSKIPLVDLR
ncbi:MAG: hypothetical protein K2N05_12450 [Muribaculaceae bacterium]|nr:hypothetical protein [Muribaculaceae bacterium]